MGNARTAGVLALQGDVPEHLGVLRRLLGSDRAILVDSPKNLEGLQALVLPGGESTTLSELLDATDLRNPIKARARQGMSILATCAGLILIAQRVERSPGGRDPVPMRLLDVTVRRNDYGRQPESFETPLEIDGMEGRAFEASFIRAPRITRTGKSVEILARFDGAPVLVRQANVWGLTFHPELSGDDRLHRSFLRSAGLL
jgi:5'-phosphate synthase pdxT subunit